jgi:hypothetical protein
VIRLFLPKYLAKIWLRTGQVVLAGCSLNRLREEGGAHKI